MSRENVELAREAYERLPISPMSRCEDSGRLAQSGFEPDSHQRRGELSTPGWTRRCGAAGVWSPQHSVEERSE
jgi:hypothetical protein